MKKYNAFTLAEVLITLAIIGVVAALTIASVVSEYRKQTYYTQFMKTYNTLSNALTLAVMANGNPDSWGILDLLTTDASNTNRQIILNNLAPYLKTLKVCSYNDKCDIPDTVHVYDLNGDDLGKYNEYYKLSGTKLILKDGTYINISASYSGSILFFITSFDVNGHQKGPNTIGRDIFCYIDFDKIGSKYELLPVGIHPDNLSETKRKTQLCKTEGDDAEPNFCAARLLYERKMNY